MQWNVVSAGILKYVLKAKKNIYIVKTEIQIHIEIVYKLVLGIHIEYTSRYTQKISRRIRANSL
jgi:hypothetical protein